MRLWAGSAHSQGYENLVSPHFVVAESQYEAMHMVLDEASKSWPDWWRNYPYTIKVKPIPEELLTIVLNQDSR